MTSLLDQARAERGEPTSTMVTVAAPHKTWAVEPATFAARTNGTIRRAPTERRPASAVTAAAKIVTQADQRDAAGSASKRTGSGWQDEAWGYYDTVGELHYAANFVGACLSRVRLLPGLLGNDAKPAPAFDEDNEPLHPLATVAEAAIAGLRSTTGGQPQMLRQAGVNLSVAGEGSLVGTDIIDPDTAKPVGRQWEILSTTELRQQADGSLKRFRVPGGQGEDLPPNTFTCRIWRSHPRYSALADSSVRAVLEVLEELVLLTRKVRAETISRLAGAGVLFVPEEISDSYKTSTDVDTGVEGGEDDDPFTADLIATMMTPIGDPTAAAAVVPMVVTAPGDDIEKVRWLVRPDQLGEDSTLVEKRKEAVIRLAQGLDLPVEIVTGHMQTTFANAAQIDEATWKAHIEPLVELLCDALTVGYLRPLLLAGGADPKDVGSLCVAFDASELITHPNRETAADAGYGTAEHPSFGISGKAWRQRRGFADGDAPDDDEIAERIRIAQLLRVRESVPGVVPASEDMPGTLPGQNAPDNPAPDNPNDTADPSIGLAASAAAAAEVAIERAVERAGARLRSKADARPGVRQLVDGVPNGDVTVVLGESLVASLGADDAELVRGEFGPFFRSVRRWATEADIADPDWYASAATATAERLAKLRLYGRVLVDRHLFAPAVLDQQRRVAA